MERILSPEEKLRRAEEIYYRRRHENEKKPNNGNVGNSLNSRKIKKMLIQMLICFAIYSFFYIISNVDFFFSEDLAKRTEEILLYDVNLKEISENMKMSIGNFWKEKIEETNGVSETIETENNEEIINETEKITETEENVQNVENNIKQENEEKKLEEAILSVSENNEEEKTSSYNQMEIDAEEIKEKFSFIKPVKGTVSSEYGVRESNNSIVTKYHTGIDIAATKGTDIIAAIDGVVELASSEGSYGNHLKIMNSDVMTVYAHCSKLCVSQGDSVVQGQKIAEVGSTRKCHTVHIYTLR